jgi:ABC-type multidrug transport system permease subunit
MGKQFSIYKGLQKPLMYKGFQGKFIGWGIASLVLGVVLGGLIGTLTHMLFGGFITIAILTGGLFFTSQQQKKGLHNKTRNKGVFLPQTELRKIYHGKAKKDSL